MELNHYVDSEKLLQEIIKYQEAVVKAKEQNLPEPLMNNYIGDCIIKISTKFAYRPNFNNYSYRDEMISDGIEAAINGVKMFDSKNWQNPFAYLTQCCYYAFLLRIKKEKIQQYTKSELIKEHGADVFTIQDTDIDVEYRDNFMKFLESNMNVSGDFLKKKKKIKAPEGLVDFSEDLNE